MNTSTQLSPLRKTTKHEQAEALAIEQAKHFGIDPNSEYGTTLIELATTLYKANTKTHDLWALTVDGLSELDKSDRIAWFNAKRFLSFQIAKILDNLQNPCAQPTNPSRPTMATLPLRVLTLSLIMLPLSSQPVL